MIGTRPRLESKITRTDAQISAREKAEKRRKIKQSYSMIGWTTKTGEKIKLFQENHREGKDNSLQAGAL